MVLIGVNLIKRGQFDEMTGDLGKQIFGTSGFLQIWPLSQTPDFKKVFFSNIIYYKKIICDELNLDGIDGWIIRYYAAVMVDPVPF